MDSQKCFPRDNEILFVFIVDSPLVRSIPEASFTFKHLLETFLETNRRLYALLFNLKLIFLIDLDKCMTILIFFLK